MLLKKITLQNFRSYKKSTFDFEITNIIVGRNTIGKTNILEGIYFLSHGKSFRAEKDVDAIKFEEEFARVNAVLEDEDVIELTVNLFVKNGFFRKRYMINNIPKRQVDFTGRLLTVLFTPSDVEIITDSPSLRRRYFDSVLSQASKKYRTSLSLYEKALRHRNKMLFEIKEGRKIPRKEEFSYWDNLLIENGNFITTEREKYINYLNESKKDTFNFLIIYDKSTITPERIEKYFEVEQKTGITLIGPQRDDFLFCYPDTNREIKEFASRGEQRLTILQIKILEIEYLSKAISKKPILLLDDIFSELDSANIEKIKKIVENQQIILTTTHQELVPKELLKKAKIINLED